MNRFQGMDFRTYGELKLAAVLRSYFGWCRKQLPEYAEQRGQAYSFGQAEPVLSPIPRTIWAFWNDKNLPLTVQRCIQTWHQQNPNYRIEVITDATIGNYLDALPDAIFRATVQQKADWLRLALLHRYGGIWLDASMILTRSLDWVLAEQERHQCDFVGFYLERFTRLPNFPVVENWFLAAPPNNPFIAAVLQEFTSQVIEKNSQAYVVHLQEQGIYEAVVQGIDSPLYLSTHLAIQRVLQAVNAHYKLVLFQAEKTAFSLHEQARWNRAGLKLRLFFREQGPSVTPLIKLRGPDRRKLDFYLQRGLFIPESIAARYLLANGDNE